MTNLQQTLAAARAAEDMAKTARAANARAEAAKAEAAKALRWRW